jgi:predicted RNA-binding Zn ribbon-like protein
MYFNHYSNRPVDLAVKLANTERAEDEIPTPEALVEFIEPWRDLWEGVARRPTGKDMKEVRALRTSLREVFAAESAQSAAERINKILSGHGAEPRVSLHTGEPHLHFEPIGSSMSSWLGAVTAMGLAAVIVEDGVDRFGICGANDCEDVYVDTSKNRSRRHCSNTCSTREAVAAHRRRKAG